MAEALLERHHSLGALFHAYGSGLFEPGHVPCKLQEHLTQLAHAYMHSLCAEAFNGVTLQSMTAVMRYLQRDMAFLDREFFRVFFLDSANRMLADRVMWVGTVDSVQVHPREVVREVLRTSATSIIIAHNHPVGTSQPSAADISVTSKMVRACAAFDVAVQDHLIIARAGVFSMRVGGILDRLERAATDIDTAELVPQS